MLRRLVFPSLVYSCRRKGRNKRFIGYLKPRPPTVVHPDKQFTVSGKSDRRCEILMSIGRYERSSVYNSSRLRLINTETGHWNLMQHSRRVSAQDRGNVVSVALPSRINFCIMDRMYLLIILTLQLAGVLCANENNVLRDYFAFRKVKRVVGFSCGNVESA